MNLNLQHVPFSRFGSYFACSHLAASANRPEGLYLRTMHRSTARYEILRIELAANGKAVPYRLVTAPDSLLLEGDSGLAELCIAGQELVRIRSRGAGVRLVVDAGVFDYAMPVGEGRWELNSFQTRRKYGLTPLAGSLKVDAPWHETHADYVIIELVPDALTRTAECALEAFDSTWRRDSYEMSFEACKAEVRGEFQSWLESTPEAPAEYAEARQMAAYVNWASVVNPSGHLTRPAMLMSKNWMTNVWSWDHCFNAMALAYKNPALAWDQLMLMVDHQDAHGAFPDSINDADIVWNFCKPPIHGWALRFMMQRCSWITPERLEQIYTPLCRWTDWWLNCRDDDQDGIPQYHHGNDSGWDNCTAFEVGPPVESADLSAYLVVQMDVLAEIARLIGREDEARGWQKRADNLLERLLAHSWRGDRFVAPRSGDHTVFESDTLLHFLPVVLGQRLPAGVRQKLAAGLKQPGCFLTPHGLATESVRSPLYQPDGYWRGPIWAPSTMILIDGLAACGEHALAKDLARRFCDMAARSGMAENYNALSGEGLRDRAYTWTSSVFLILAHDYLLTQAEP